jgi:hypothetical protein
MSADWLYDITIVINQLYSPTGYITREGSTDGYFQYSTDDWRHVNALWISLLRSALSQLSTSWSRRLVYLVALIARQINLTEFVDWSLLEQSHKLYILLPSTRADVKQLHARDWHVIRQAYAQLLNMCNIIILQQPSITISNIGSSANSTGGSSSSASGNKVVNNSGVCNTILPFDFVSSSSSSSINQFPLKSEIDNRDFHAIVDHIDHIRSLLI